jgi:hypothetical protein
MHSHEHGAQKKSYTVVGVSALKKPQELIDQLSQHGQTVLIMKHGKPLVFMSPITTEQVMGFHLDYNPLAFRPVAPAAEEAVNREEYAMPRTDPLKMSQSITSLPAMLPAQPEANLPVVSPVQAIPIQAIEFNGQTIHIDEEMSLTELWKASGKSRGHNPTEWARREGTEFIANLKTNTSVRRNLIRTERGRKGGTFAHWQIGMEYARYLSPELAAVCNQIVKDFVEANPELAQSVIARASQAGVAMIATTAIDHTMDPQALENIKSRVNAKLNVLDLASEMVERGASHLTFQAVTTENYLAVTNMHPKDINRDAGRSLPSSPRDLLSPPEQNILNRLVTIQLQCLRVSEAKGHDEILEVITSVTGAL